MALSTSGRTWEDASSQAALRLARRFEADWRRVRAEHPSRVQEVLTSYLAEAQTKGVPGAGLAMIRAEMALRWEFGDQATAADYFSRISGASREVVVALLYEEFCLREEAGERPEPGEYLAKYPEHALALRRVLEIHGLVGSGTSTAFVPQTSGPAFPSAGETIAGFRLVEELGRGAFARVFLAEERQLADRPVALKTSRTGSREPQALARLQHTHIVPVHSYRTDPATGLHLLCMPFFGRVTLASLLSDPGAKVARGGADLLEALDRLGASDPPPSGRAAVRAFLAPKNYPRAIAWWGARMAEALDHAHGVGLLHRDVKPSNVLVTRDGLPMLLDFNLARDAVIDPDDPEAAVPGGTLDYMSPEQLEELSQGVSDRVDPRSDIYGLGVLLFEALAGSRPFPTPRSSGPISDLLDKAAEHRKGGAPRMREWRPEVPSALEAVVGRCLAAKPSDRYANASDLATDLQAVADDRPLRFAREPIADRAYRWARRNRRAILMTIPVLLALGLSASLVLRDRLERSRIREEVVALFKTAELAESQGKFEEAAVQFNAAFRLAERPELGGLPRQVAALRNRGAVAEGHGLVAVANLDELRELARRRAKLAEQTGTVRANAQRVSAAAETLRFRLTGFGGDFSDAAKALGEVLEPFYVFAPPRWFERPDLTLLDEPGRLRLVDEVNELLFLLALAFDDNAEREANGRPLAEVERSRTLLREARLLCDRALEFASPRGPWLALRARVVSLGEGVSPPEARPIPVEPTGLGCFQWGALRLQEGHRELAAAHFRDAVRIDPGNYWYQYDLAFAHDDPSESPEEALRHYDNALVLKPRSPWVQFSRGRLRRSSGNWGPAAEDLQHALSDFLAFPESARPPAFEAQIRLELGLVRQSLADAAGARREYNRVIRTDPTGSYSRAARLNLAKLDADEGRVEEALEAYNALIYDEASDRQARRARSLLAIRRGDWEVADRDLTWLIHEAKGSSAADGLGFRALSRLARGEPRRALADAEASLALIPSPRVDRLRLRALLALGRFEDLRLHDPAILDALPLQGPRLIADVQRLAVASLPTEAVGSKPTAAALLGRLNRAVALAWLGRRHEAREQATAAVGAAPLNARARLVLARILLITDGFAAAREEVDRALLIDPESQSLWVFRGRLALLSGEPEQGLADLDRARALGADGAVYRATRALALQDLGEPRQATREWTLALSHDPENPLVFLGRARAFLDLGQHDQAIADLELASDWGRDRPRLILRIALAYARCVPNRPALAGRVLALARSAFRAG